MLYRSLIIPSLYKYLGILTLTSIISLNILTAAPCVDDPNGVVAATSAGDCVTIVSWFACSGTAFGTVDVDAECPVTCSACPGTCGDGIYDWDETGIPDPTGNNYASSEMNYCIADVPGCSLNDKQLSIITADADASLLNGTTLPAGAVVFNSSENIAGWQFDIQGATVTGASGGEAGLAGHITSFNAGFGTVLGYANDPTTSSVPAGCGVLIVATITGTATGITNLVFSDPNATEISFTLNVDKVGPTIPSDFTISQNFPNPFNPATYITFDVPAGMGDISLKVYDLSGKEIITLASGSLLPGKYSVNWNAVNNYGEPVASGMYVYRYVSNEAAITRKMLYMK